MKRIRQIFAILTIGTSIISGLAYAEEAIIKTSKEGGYTLYVKNKPFLMKGVIYSPRPIGAGYDEDFFLDEKKPWLVDGKLMKEAGINCVRIYSVDSDLEKVKQFIKEMHDKYGIYTLASDWLGLWSYPGANYADPEFQKQTKERILKIIAALKDEKGLLMWILGNENNYTFSGKIGFWTSPEIENLEEAQRVMAKAEIYYKFINELVKEIKKIDKIHPVVMSNGEENYLNIAAKNCPDIDALGIIAYRGKTFAGLFRKVKSFFDKPLFLSEFGCDSYDAFKNIEDQDTQAKYLLSQWNEIYNSSTFSGQKDGNCLGGTIFEWTDEWWKHNEGYQPDWNIHNKEAGWSNGSYFNDVRAKDNLNMNEEWFGIAALSSEEKEVSWGTFYIDKRLPKTAYYALKDYFAKLPRTPLNKKVVPKPKKETNKK